MIHEEQIDLRRERARLARLEIENLGKNRVFSDYRVTNPASGGCYTVSIHGFDLGDNACTCPDYKSNTLGTCKHIEAVLEHLKPVLTPPLRKKKATFARPEVYLHYGKALTLGIHLPAKTSDKLKRLAETYFDAKGLWNGRGDYAEFVAAVEAVPEAVTVLSDAMDFIAREVDQAELLTKEAEWLARLEAGTLDLALLNVPLYDYQLRGALFLACRGRCILGDDMGLGKTVQTLAAVELLARERGVGRVLVVAPASVKYQWEAEIRRFTPRAVQVIDGSPEERKRQYSEPTFYRLVNYEQVVRDLDELNQFKPDVVVLDEAQRIKNWEAKTSRAVKKLKSRYAMVLTGTPLENRLEELFSIVQFVDERRFGPAFQFLSEHQVLDDDGRLVGYRHLDAIRQKLAPIFLRRTRAEVLTQLPARTDTTVTVELGPVQTPHYEQQKSALARLAAKPYLGDLDRKRVLACLVNLRMICNSSFLFDKETHESPKLDEFAELVPGLTAGGHKLVAFSQWETMAHEAAAVLTRLGIGHRILHGGLSGNERKRVLDDFRDDPAVAVLLSTDSGGVGLNLQVADAVVNWELPWNPAVFEQRVARVHRLGQSRPVRVVNFVTRNTIEERVALAMTGKQAMFAELFEGDEESVALEPGAAPFLEVVRGLLGDLPREIPANVEKSPPPVDPSDAGADEAFWQATAEVISGVVKLVRSRPGAEFGRAGLAGPVGELARWVAGDSRPKSGPT